MNKKGIIELNFPLVRIVTTISHPTVMFQVQSSKNLAAFQTFFKVFQTLMPRNATVSLDKSLIKTYELGKYQ